MEIVYDPSVKPAIPDTLKKYFKEQFDKEGKS